MEQVEVQAGGLRAGHVGFVGQAAGRVFGDVAGDVVGGLHGLPHGLGREVTSAGRAAFVADVHRHGQ